MQLKVHGLAIELAADWTKNPSGAMINTSQPQTPMSLTVEREAIPEDIDVSAYAKNVATLLAEEFEAFEIFDEGEWDVAGVPGIYRQHAFAFQGQDVGQIQLYFVKDHFAYSVTLGYPGRAYDDGMAAAEEVFGAVQFS